MHHDLSGLVFHVAAFLALVVLKASRSLMSIGCQLDALQKGGRGIDFNPEYFDELNDNSRKSRDEDE